MQIIRMRIQSANNNIKRRHLASWWTTVVFLGLPSIVQRVSLVLVHAEDYGPGPPSRSPTPSSSSVFTPVGGVGIDTLANDTDPVITIDEPLAPTQPLLAASRSSISGHAYLTNSTLGYGMDNVSVDLFTCTGNIINTTKINASGHYSFEELYGGQYYVSSVPPQGYVFSNLWDDYTNETEELEYLGGESAVNPDTRSTECFDLKDGEDKTVSFGMTFNVSSNTGPMATASPSELVEPTSETSNSLITASTIPPFDITSLHTSQLKSQSPSMIPSHKASLNPTSSFHPTAMPSVQSSRSGDLYGPATMEGLVMAIRGIQVLEDEAAWSVATTNHIVEYFNLTIDDPGVFDVTVSIEVMKQTSGDDAVFQRRRPHQQQQQHHRKTRRRRRRRRGLRSDFDIMEVIYSQTFSYKTSNSSRYDEFYVAMAPFSTRQGSEGYIAALRALSPYYEEVWSVGFVRFDRLYQMPTGEGTGSEGFHEPSNNDTNNDDENIKGSEPGGADTVQDPLMGGNQSSINDNEVNEFNPLYIMMIGCGVAVLVSTLVLRALRRETERRTEFADQLLDGDMENISSILHEFKNIMPPSTPSMDDDDDSEDKTSNDGHAETECSIFTNPAKQISSSYTTMVNVIAPDGKLGVFVETPPSGGPACVCEIRETCPIFGQIKLKDKIIAVDDEDVADMPAADVRELLEQKSGQAERKITLLREVPSDKDDDDIEIVEEVSSCFIPLIQNAAIQPDQRLDIIASSGRLGVVLASPKPPLPHGPAYVLYVVKDSPLVGEVHVGDKVIAVDDDDVQDMTAEDINKLLASKSRNMERKITVTRETSGVGQGGDAMDETGVYDSTDKSTAVNSFPSNPAHE